jgi:hypothetical protein
MESSRDSSVWRNLAVTFGGGLALGAVGMKLTQTALRPVEVTPRPEPEGVTGRLKVMERRLEKMEQAPAAARPAPAGPVVPMDQKVLEAVIGAVDARLHEHAGQMDRRLADLEARMAVAQGLQQQDRQASGQLRQEAADLRTAMEQELHRVRESVSRVVAGQAAAKTDFEMLRRQQEQQVSEMRQEYRHEAAKLRAELEQSVEARIVTAAAAAAATQLEEQLGPLRAEVRQKEQELAGLRQRLAESEKSVLDVVLAIGEVCRQAADRIGGVREAKPATPPAAPLAPDAEMSPRVEGKVEEAGPEPAPRPKLETLPVPRADSEVPPFLRDATPRLSWRVPLVSSLLMSTGYLVLMHYLSASLQ